MDMSVEHFRGALRGVAEYARPHRNWELHRAEATQAGIRQLLDERIDGLIVGALYEPELSLAKSSFAHVVSVGSTCRTPNLNTVHHDEDAIGAMAADYLILQHFPNFAGAALAGKLQDDRVLAFQRAIQAKHFACPLFVERNDANGNKAAFAEWLVALPKPCALFCDCDERAWLAAEACRQRNISIPGELAILGVDNDEVVCSLSDPALSSVEVASEEIGYAAAERLNASFSGAALPSTTLLIPPLRIVERRSTDASITSDPMIREAIGLMHRELGVEAGIDYLSKKLGCSRRTFERRFLDQTGMSPSAMWMHLKMREAERLLLETNLSMEVVASLCGFSESRGLSANFRKHAGITPSEFRKRARLTEPKR